MSGLLRVYDERKQHIGWLPAPTMVRTGEHVPFYVDLRPDNNPAPRMVVLQVREYYDIEGIASHRGFAMPNSVLPLLNRMPGWRPAP